VDRLLQKYHTIVQKAAQVRAVTKFFAPHKKIVVHLPSAGRMPLGGFL